MVAQGDENNQWKPPVNRNGSFRPNLGSGDICFHVWGSETNEARRAQRPTGFTSDTLKRELSRAFSNRNGLCVCEHLKPGATHLGRGGRFILGLTVGASWQAWGKRAANSGLNPI